jgi:LCP family protein required for cell wall assembly
MPKRYQSPADQPAYTGETIVQRRLPPQARRRIWPIVRTALLVLLGMTIAALVLLYIEIGRASAPLTVTDARPNAPIASPLGSANILLIGVDARAGAPQEGVRGDTLIVIRLDPVARNISMLSIPRDTRAEVRDLGPSKINAAYAYGAGAAELLYGPGTTPEQGGMALAAETVEQLLGLRIDYTAQVNFEGFAAIVDALGGITVDVPRRIVDDAYPTEDFGTMRVVFEPGPQRMDGATALIYARTRHADSDFGRSERQQQVIRAIADELRARGALGQLQALAALRDALPGTLTTTLPLARLDTIAAFGWTAAGLDPDAIGRYQISPESVPVFTTEGSDIIWDPAGLRDVVERFLAGPGEEQEQARVQVLNGTDVSGLARRVTDRLQQEGFSTLDPADAPGDDNERTVVYDTTGNPHTSRRLAELLGAELRRAPAPEGVASPAEIVVILGRDSVTIAD